MNTMAWARWKGGFTTASLNGAPGMSTSQAQKRPWGASVAPSGSKALIIVLTVLALLCRGKMPTVGHSAQLLPLLWGQTAGGGCVQAVGFTSLWKLGMSVGAFWLVFQ